jgi:hypothetical protein
MGERSDYGPAVEHVAVAEARELRDVAVDVRGRIAERLGALHERGEILERELVPGERRGQRLRRARAHFSAPTWRAASISASALFASRSSPA